MSSVKGFNFNGQTYKYDYNELDNIPETDPTLTEQGSAADAKATGDQVNALSARMDSFTHLSEGSTTGDAELIDGRTGADGTTYNNIGTAIRTQVTNLNNAVTANTTAIAANTAQVATNTQDITNVKNELSESITTVTEGKSVTVDQAFSASETVVEDFAIPKGCLVKVTVSDWTTSDYYIAVAFRITEGGANQQITYYVREGVFYVTTTQDYAQVAVWSTEAASSLNVKCEVIGLYTYDIEKINANVNRIITGDKYVIDGTLPANAVLLYDYYIPKRSHVTVSVTGYASSSGNLAVSFGKIGQGSGGTNWQLHTFTSNENYELTTEDDYYTIRVWSRYGSSSIVITVSLEDITGFDGRITDVESRLDTAEPLIADNAEAIDAIHTITEFKPTLSGNNFYSYAITAGRGYKVTNNGSSNISLSTRTSNSGGSVIEVFGTIEAGKSIFFEATSSAEWISFYATTADQTALDYIEEGYVADAQVQAKHAQDTIDARINSIVNPVVTDTTWSSSRIVVLPITVYSGQTLNFLISDYQSTKNHSSILAFGYVKNNGAPFYQQLTVTEVGIYQIKATADYDCAYVYISDSTVSAFRATVWVEGSIEKYRNFSVIGDSYTTFQEYNPNGYATWYPNVAITSGNDCQTVEATWWYKFAQDYGCAIQRNESYSGTSICNDGWGSGTDDASQKSFIARMNLLPQSDLIFIFGGTNDDWIPVSLGEYVYSGWTSEQLQTFRPAMAYLLDWLMHHHVGAKIIFIKNSGLTNVGDSIDTICSHYSIPQINLTSAVSKVDSHPDTHGMREIMAQVMDYLVRY